jgi:hypothetical protein
MLGEHALADTIKSFGLNADLITKGSTHPDGKWKGFEVSIGTQKGPPIGVQKGSLSLRFVRSHGCFFVRLTGAVSSSRPDHPKASGAAAVRHGRRPPAEPARSVLDGGEHGAKLEQRRVIGSAALLQRRLSSPVSSKPTGASGFGSSPAQSRPKPRGGTIA